MAHIKLKTKTNNRARINDFPYEEGDTVPFPECRAEGHIVGGRHGANRERLNFTLSKIMKKSDAEISRKTRETMLERSQGLKYLDQEMIDARETLKRLRREKKANMQMSKMMKDIQKQQEVGMKERMRENERWEKDENERWERERSAKLRRIQLLEAQKEAEIESQANETTSTMEIQPKETILTKAAALKRVSNLWKGVVEPTQEELVAVREQRKPSSAAEVSVSDTALPEVRDTRSIETFRKRKESMVQEPPNGSMLAKYLMQKRRFSKAVNNVKNLSAFVS